MTQKRSPDRRWLLLLLLFPVLLSFPSFFEQIQRARQPKRLSVTPELRPNTIAQKIDESQKKNKKHDAKTPKKSLPKNSNIPKTSTKKKLSQRTTVGSNPRPRERVTIIQIDPPPTPQRTNRSGVLYPFRIKPVASDRRYAKLYQSLKSWKMGPYEKTLLQAFVESRLAEAYMERRSRRSIQAEALRYFRYRGISNYRNMGLWLLQHTETMLANYMAKGGPLLQLQRDPSPHAARAIQLARYAGNYPLLFRRFGVPNNAKQLSPLQRFWIRTTFLTRWAKLLWGHAPMAVFLGKDGYIDYLRARLIWARNPNSRIWSARELGRVDPKTDFSLVFGWLLIELKRPAMARGYLEQALKNKESQPLAQRLLQKLPAPPQIQPSTKPATQPATHPTK